ncbi:MAG: uroporphyrinogen decarboxylase family protein [Candidatus Latescibacterota bacterium]|jgi:hypothetical protein
MTPRERVHCAFEHRPYDKVPIYQTGFSAAVASQVLGREAYIGGGRVQYLEARALWEGEQAHQEYLARCWQDAVDLCRTLALDVVRTQYWRLPERPTRRVDEFTFVYGDERTSYRVMRHDPQTELYQVVDRSPASEPTLDDLERTVEAEEQALERYAPHPSAFDAYRRTVAEFGEDGVPYGGAAVGLCIPREPAWLEAVALRPDLVRRYLDAQAERAARQAALAGRQGVRFGYGGGDFATPRGPLVSPRAFHELMLPALQRISAACEAAGVLHGFATDGNVWSVAEDLFGASGVRFFYECDTLSGMDLRRLRKAYPRLTLLGGINSQTLHTGKVEDVVAETRRALAAAKDLGGCIVGCSNQIVAGTPMENFWAMMEVLHRER